MILVPKGNIQFPPVYSIKFYAHTQVAIRFHGRTVNRRNLVTPLI